METLRRGRGKAQRSANGALPGDLGNAIERDKCSSVQLCSALVGFALIGINASDLLKCIAVVSKTQSFLAQCKCRYNSATVICILYLFAFALPPVSAATIIIMSVMLHLECNFIIPRHNYQSETRQQI